MKAASVIFEVLATFFRFFGLAQSFFALLQLRFSKPFTVHFLYLFCGFSLLEAFEHCDLFSKVTCQFEGIQIIFFFEPARSFSFLGSIFAKTTAWHFFAPCCLGQFLSLEKVHELLLVILINSRYFDLPHHFRLKQSYIWPFGEWTLMLSIFRHIFLSYCGDRFWNFNVIS